MHGQTLGVTHGHAVVEITCSDRIEMSKDLGMHFQSLTRYRQRLILISCPAYMGLLSSNQSQAKMSAFMHTHVLFVTDTLHSRETTKDLTDIAQCDMQTLMPPAKSKVVHATYCSIVVLLQAFHSC
jgi:hypothetical protein